MLGTEEHFFDLDFYDLLPNPNKFDECDPDLMLNQPPTQNIIRSAVLIKCQQIQAPNIFQFFTAILEVCFYITSYHVLPLDLGNSKESVCEIRHIVR